MIMSGSWRFSHDDVVDVGRPASPHLHLPHPWVGLELEVALRRWFVNNDDGCHRNCDGCHRNHDGCHGKVEGFQLERST